VAGVAAAASTTWWKQRPEGGRLHHAGDEEDGLHIVFVGGVDELHLSITMERSSIYASPFRSSVGGEFRSHSTTKELF
jgi:hypothetical protein